MKKYITKQSGIKGAGKGLFTKESFKKGEVIGLAHIDDQPASEIGRNHNHNEKNPTANNIKDGNKRYLIASRNLNPGEEITTNYRLQPELEQPEDFMRKGGSLLKMPNKKNSKGYSRSLSATNKLFTENYLFAKPKSRKNKVFDPNSKYYAEGGSLLTKKVTCKSCGWKWDAEDGGKDITTCHKCGGQGLVHAQDGGKTDAMTGMMKARLAYANEFGNPAAERMINLPDNPYQFDNGDTGSHYMASMDNYAVPQIQDENGVLQLKDYGPESNEAIRFDSDEDANYFAENYKNVSPGFINEKQYGGLNKFVDGGKVCPKGEYWNGKKCVKLPKNAFITSDLKKYIQRKAAYDDSLNHHKAYLFQDALTPGHYKINNNVWKYETGKDKGWATEKAMFDDITGLGPCPSNRPDCWDKEKKAIKYYKSLGFTDKDIQYHTTPDIVTNRMKPSGSYSDYPNGFRNPIYKKPVQEVIFDEPQKIITEKKIIKPTTRTVYVDCPSGSVSNGQIKDVTTPDPESPGNYLRTITTGCELEKIENLPILKPGLIKQQNYELQGADAYMESLEPSDEENEEEESAIEEYKTGKIKSETDRRINWNGTEVPYRLLGWKFRQPENWDKGLINTKLKGKKRYAHLPTIEKRKNTYILDSDGNKKYITINDYKQYGGISNDYIETDLDEDEIEEYRRGGYIVEEIDNYQDGGVYTVKGSKGAYKKVNGKWQVDWNRSGKYQPLSKGDIKARTAVLDKMAKPVLSEEPFNPRALLVNAKTQREKTKDAPKIKVEPISESIQLKGDAYKKNYDDKGKEIKPITLTVEEGEEMVKKNREQNFNEIKDKVKEYTIDPIINTGKRIYNDPLKFASDIGTTALDISQLGPEAAMTIGSYLFDDKKNYFDVDTDALGTSFDALSIIPAFKMLKGSKNLIKGYKKVSKQLPGSPNSINQSVIPTQSLISKFNNKIDNGAAILEQVFGKTLKGKSNKKAVDEGNEWLNNWINNPITQKKIDFDWKPYNSRTNFLKDELDLGYEQAKTFVPASKEYPLSKQFKELIKGRDNIHIDNKGVSYIHSDNPLFRIDLDPFRYKDVEKFPRSAGSWISRNPFMSQTQRASTTVHEGVHDWVTDFLLKNSGQKDNILKTLEPSSFEKLVKWKNKEKLSKEDEYIGYLANPTEVHARIMQLRKQFDMTPEESVQITSEIAQKIMNTVKRLPKKEQVVDPRFFDVIGNNPEKLAFLFRRLWGVVPVVGTAGLLNSKEKKHGGSTNDYVDVDLTPEEIKDLIAQGYVIEELN